MAFNPPPAQTKTRPKRRLDWLNDGSTAIRWYNRINEPLSRTCLVVSLLLLAAAIAMRGFDYHPELWLAFVLVVLAAFNAITGWIGYASSIFLWLRIALRRHAYVARETLSDAAGYLPDELRDHGLPDAVRRQRAGIERTAERVERGCRPLITSLATVVVASAVVVAYAGPAPLRLLPAPVTGNGTTSNPNDLTHVDWASFTYVLGGSRAGQSVKATNGKGTLSSGGQGVTFLLPPTYGDLNGDGQPEAAVRFLVCGADCGSPELVVYTGTRDHPVLMAEPKLDFDSSQGHVYWGPDTVSISNEVMTLSGPGYSPPTPSCCPDLSVTASYRWNGSSFVIVSEQTGPLATPTP